MLTRRASLLPVHAGLQVSSFRPFCGSRENAKRMYDVQVRCFGIVDRSQGLEPFAFKSNHEAFKVRWFFPDELQMKELITAREANGDGLLHRAADSGHMDVFGAVLGALGSRLSREEVRGVQRLPPRIHSRGGAGLVPLVYPACASFLTSSSPTFKHRQRAAFL